MKKRTTRIVWRSNGTSSRTWFAGARAYADCRDYADVGGRLYEPLIGAGEKHATTDQKVAEVLAAAKIKEYEAKRLGVQIVGVAEGATLKSYAVHHLRQKKIDGEATDWTLGGVERCLKRAVDYFGADRPLASITVPDVKA